MGIEMRMWSIGVENIGLTKETLDHFCTGRPISIAVTFGSISSS